MSDLLRVLLVDDNPDDRDLVLHQLRREFRAVAAEPIFDSVGLEAALIRHEFDVVITGYQLRWTNGIAVTAAIKRRFPNCPVIMITGTGSEEVAVQAMKTGLDDYIIKKPGHFNRLRAATRSVMQQSRTARRANELATRLEALLERFNVGVFRCDSGGELLEASSAFSRLLQMVQWGYEHGPPVPESFLKLDECVDLIQSVQESGQPHEKELKFHDSAGHPIWFKLSATLSETLSGEPLIDALLEDITERKRSEEELRKRASMVARLALLSPREHEVMKLVAAGNTNKAIAHQLGIVMKTVEMHRAHAMKKLRVGSVAELVRLVVTADARPLHN